jgi:hypothetical protein
MKNFTNGAVVHRLWHFDGSGELISKHQYYFDACLFAQMKMAEDVRLRPDDSGKWFYLASCEAENECRAFTAAQAIQTADHGETR